MKQENERKMLEEILNEKEEQKQEKIGKKVAWNNFLQNLEQQKQEEIKAEEDRRKKELIAKEKERKRLEKAKK